MLAYSYICNNVGYYATLLKTNIKSMNNLATIHSANKDGRQVSRRILMTGVLVSVNNGPALKGKTLDINEYGVSLLIDDYLPNQTKLVVQLTIFGMNSKDVYILQGHSEYCILKGMEGYRVGMAVTNMDRNLIRHIENLPAID